MKETVMYTVHWDEIEDISMRKYKELDQEAKKRIEPMRRKLELAQDRYNQANIEVNKYQNQKQQSTLIDNDLLEMALDERQEILAEIQQLKADIEKVETWRTQKVGEMISLQKRAKNGDYLGFRGLRDYNTELPPTSKP